MLIVDASLAHVYLYRLHLDDRQKFLLGKPRLVSSLESTAVSRACAPTLNIGNGCNDNRPFQLTAFQREFRVSGTRLKSALFVCFLPT